VDDAGDWRPTNTTRVKLPDHIYRRLVLFNTAVLFAIVLLAVLAVSTRRERVAEILRSWIDRDLASSAFIEAFSSDEDAEPLEYPLFDLRIDSPEMRQIELQTRQLVERGVMTDDLVAWYSARLFHDGAEYKVKVRLRGDLGAHWEDNKKSWRLKFPKEAMFQGRRVLDLVVPNDKAFEVEKVAHDVARELGLLVPNSGFANLRINGVDFGAYLWMEKYGPEMLEKQGYAVGEIFRNQNLWTQTRFSGFGINADEFTSSTTNTVHDEPRPDPNASRWDRLTWLTRDADDATFRSEIPQLLRVEKFLTWNAVTWLFGSLHAHGPDNLRWYYDNTSGLFEPILYDVYRYPIRLPAARDSDIPRWRFESHENLPLARRLLQMPNYRQRRNEILWRLVNESEFDVAQRCDEYFQRLRSGLLTGVGSWDSSEVDKFHKETIRILSDNRDDLREHLAFARLFVTPSAAVHDSKATIRLRLLPDCRSLVAIDRVSITFATEFADYVQRNALDVVLTGLAGERRTIEGVGVSSSDDRKTLILGFDDFNIWTPVDGRLAQYPAEWTLNVDLGEFTRSVDVPGAGVVAVAVEGHNSVTGQPIEASHVIQSPLIDGGDASPTSSSQSLDEFVSNSGLPWQVESDRLVLPPGEHRISGTLTIPSGMGLQLGAGTTLQMGPSASLISYGPLLVAGSEADPVRIVPAEEEQPWGTIAVVRAAGTSRVQHLEVHGGSECRANGLFLSGQLCFYWSDAELLDCVFHDARADDACNVKNAQLSMKGCLFYDNLADGLDADFVNGSVESCSFLNSGGDGVDVSGSRLLVRDCLFDDMRDKGISVGEKSNLFAFNCVIQNCLIGLASKDLSAATLYASVFRANETAVALYRKKQIFGGGQAKAVGVLFWENEQEAEVDGESQLEVRGIAADSWDPSVAAGGEPVVVDDPSRFYAADSRAGILHKAGKTDSPFVIQATTAGETFDNFAAPDMQGKPAGLLAPLNLPSIPGE